MSLNKKGANPGKEKKKNRLICNGLHFWERFLILTLVMKGVCWLLVCGVF